MDTTFATEIAEWREFYAAIAGTAGTLLGLLFVSLAINPAIMRDDTPNGTRVWAAETFHNFLVVLAIALIALIPDQTPLGVGIPVFVLGAHGAYRVTRDILEARSDPDPRWRESQQLTRFGAPAIAYALIFWAGVEALQGDEVAMQLLIPVIFLLVISAASSCWDLLKEIGDPRPGA